MTEVLIEKKYHEELVNSRLRHSGLLIKAKKRLETAKLQIDETLRLISIELAGQESAIKTEKGEDAPETGGDTMNKT